MNDDLAPVGIPAALVGCVVVLGDLSPEIAPRDIMVDLIGIVERYITEFVQIADQEPDKLAREGAAAGDSDGLTRQPIPHSRRTYISCEREDSGEAER